MVDPEKKTPSKAYAFYLIGGLAIVLLALFLLGFFPRYFQRTRLEEKAARDDIPKVSIIKLKPEKSTSELVLPTSLQALRVTPLWARTNGYLSVLLVDIGDHVKEGQLLAIIDTPEVDKQVDQAKADLASAVSRREIAKISNERWAELYAHNPQAISTQEVDDRKATYVSSIADANSAEANLKRLEDLQSFKNIYAPFDGVIAERNVDIGSLITAGSSGMPQQLFIISKIDVLRAFVSVPQYNFRSIYDGLPAKVIIREFPDEVFHGKVVRNARSLDPIARTLMTEVDIDNKNGVLVPGLYAEVQFTLTSDQTRFIVPTEAIIIRTGLPHVALLNKDNRIELKTVKIAHDLGSKMEIMDGLHENDTLVINPNEKIREGTQVQILDHRNKKKDT